MTGGLQTVRRLAASDTEVRRLRDFLLKRMEQQRLSGILAKNILL